MISDCVEHHNRLCVITAHNKKLQRHQHHHREKTSFKQTPVGILKWWKCCSFSPTLQINLSSLKWCVTKHTLASPIRETHGVSLPSAWENKVFCVSWAYTHTHHIKSIILSLTHSLYNSASEILETCINKAEPLFPDAQKNCAWVVFSWFHACFMSDCSGCFDLCHNPNHFNHDAYSVTIEEAATVTKIKEIDDLQIKHFIVLIKSCFGLWSSLTLLQCWDSCSFFFDSSWSPTRKYLTVVILQLPVWTPRVQWEEEPELEFRANTLLIELPGIFMTGWCLCVCVSEKP